VIVEVTVWGGAGPACCTAGVEAVAGARRVTVGGSTMTTPDVAVAVVVAQPTVAVAIGLKVGCRVGAGCVSTMEGVSRTVGDGIACLGVLVGCNGAVGSAGGG